MAPMPLWDGGVGAGFDLGVEVRFGGLVELLSDVELGFGGVNAVDHIMPCFVSMPL
jgi:hypothetical protein